MPVRKLTRRKKTLRYDANAAVVIPIYQRAVQGTGRTIYSDKASDPARVEKILAEAQERRERRPQKTRVFTPTNNPVRAESAHPWEYRRLQNGQIVGHPRPMCEVKREARRTRFQRRATFRLTKRFAAITEAVTQQAEVDGAYRLGIHFIR